MDSQNKNLILATVLSFVVVVAWFLLFPPPEKPPASAEQTTAQLEDKSGNLTPDAGSSTAATTGGAPTGPTATGGSDIANSPRIQIDTPALKGSIALTGGRIDTLDLKDYHETLDDSSPDVTLFKPSGEKDAYYAIYGWVGTGDSAKVKVPGDNTPWTAPEGAKLTPSTPVTLSWDNGAGLVFHKTYAIDDKYMFTVTQSVENNTDAPVSLRPYGLLRHEGIPSDLQNFFVVHEGMIGMADGTLTEEKYKKIKDLDVNPNEGVPAQRTEVKDSGWVGFTQHYWMSTLIPGKQPFRSTVKFYPNADVYQTEAVLDAQTVAPKATAQVKTQLFAGAKEADTIKAYQDAGVPRFFDSIDWGWFFFLTKPIFWLIHWLHGFIGNMGWSIIAMTIFLKALLFPLAYKSYASMAKMKSLQPEMEKLKERCGDDRQKLQKEMMALYKKEKVNPAAGCLPVLLQIPIFFSLYKVIFVTLELRHQPWIGWIHDLSAPDPSSILNLFGLLPWGTPAVDSPFHIISLGALPILLGISMWLQQRLNPAPQDPSQKMIFAWMPWVFMFMLGRFASGLVLYWITNNTITFVQQYLIMRFHGYKPDVFGNIKESIQLPAFLRKKKADGKDAK